MASILTCINSQHGVDAVMNKDVLNLNLRVVRAGSGRAKMSTRWPVEFRASCS